MLVDDDIRDETAKRWQPFFANAEATLALGRQILADGHALMANATVPQKLSLFFLARATQAFNSVEVLFSAGLATDSTATLRTLVELAIDFQFIWHAETDDRVRLYVEFIQVANHRRLEAHERIYGPSDPTKAAEAFATIAANAPPGISSAADMRAFIDAEYERVKVNYPNKGQWHRRNTRDRAVDVQMDNLYDLVHRRGSEASHSNATALSLLYAISDGAISVSGDPETPSEVMPLATACMIYQALLSAVCDKIGMPEVAQIEYLHSDLKSAIANTYPDKVSA